MSSSATDTQTIAVSMPQMGISVSEGTILEWRKAVGDPVEADETICDVTTDKVDVEIPCPATGVLARILAEPGETVPVGEPIAEIDTGGGGAADGSRRTGEWRGGPAERDPCAGRGRPLRVHLPRRPPHGGRAPRGSLTGRGTRRRRADSQEGPARAPRRRGQTRTRGRSTPSRHTFPTRPPRLREMACGSR